MKTKSNVRFAFALVLSLTAGCGETVWLRDVGDAAGPTSIADAGAVVCQPGSAVLMSSCDRLLNCQIGSSGRTCRPDGLDVEGACRAFTACQPADGGVTPTDSGVTPPPPPPPPVDSGVVPPPPVDAGTPVDSGTSVDAGTPTGEYVDIGIDGSYFTVLRDANGNSTGVTFCGGRAEAINLRCYDNIGGRIEMPLLQLRHVVTNSGWQGLFNCDITCGVSNTLYPVPAAWARNRSITIGTRGVTTAFVSRPGMGDVRSRAVWCDRVPGGMPYPKLSVPMSPDNDFGCE